MSLLPPTDRASLEAFARLSNTNPFLPERIQAERDALGADFAGRGELWSLRADSADERANIEHSLQRAEPTARRLRDLLARGERATPDELELYQSLVYYLLYHRYRVELSEEVERKESKGRDTRVSWYARFQTDCEEYLRIEGVRMPAPYDPAHLFACFFQVRRAFHHIFSSIVGGSLPAAKLRAAVWQSIFTHDLRRYQRVLFAKMADVTTLVSGPSGTGKELVARAIGLSLYVPFDAKAQRFTESFQELFHPLNLAALPQTLIESELFGHQRGAFTGALADHAGYFEVCKPLGAVFLDEIGEAELHVQTKLLRVMQTRTFQRLGDTTPRRFAGKVIAATNRDLGTEIAARRFREDLYYRLCADQIVTPSLQEQIQDSPDELENLVRYLVQGIAGEDDRRLSNEVVAWIDTRLGRDYAWPGNIRELEQCVRNVMVRREYHPTCSKEAPTRSAAEALALELEAGKLSADEVLRRYCTLVYARTRNLVETARLLDLDRRTVRSKIDRAQLNGATGTVEEHA